jgi:hypothetical protein
VREVIAKEGLLKSEADLIKEVKMIWSLSEREYQHAAIELALRHSKVNLLSLLT